MHPLRPKIRAAIAALANDIYSAEKVIPSQEMLAGFIGGALCGVIADESEFHADAPEGTAEHDAFMFGRFAAIHYSERILACIRALASEARGNDRLH